MREYVSKNIPVIITDLANDWPALQRWSMPYLNETLADTVVTVSRTPNGRADAILELSKYPITIEG
jgi:hypothetical protein